MYSGADSEKVSVKYKESVSKVSVNNTRACLVVGNATLATAYSSLPSFRNTTHAGTRRHAHNKPIVELRFTFTEEEEDIKWRIKEKTWRKKRIRRRSYLWARSLAQEGRVALSTHREDPWPGGDVSDAPV